MLPLRTHTHMLCVLCVCVCVCVCVCARAAQAAVKSVPSQADGVPMPHARCTIGRRARIACSAQRITGRPCHRRRPGWAAPCPGWPAAAPAPPGSWRPPPRRTAGPALRCQTPWSVWCVCVCVCVCVLAWSSVEQRGAVWVVCAQQGRTLRGVSGTATSPAAHLLAHPPTTTHAARQHRTCTRKSRMCCLNARLSSIAIMPATAAWICTGVMLGKLAASRPHTYSPTYAALLG
jgi:hypothetical protein